jgi:hypothetical protein
MKVNWNHRFRRRRNYRLFALLALFLLFVLLLWKGQFSQQNELNGALLHSTKSMNQSVHVRLFNNNTNTIVHVGRFGLGHRLSKLAAVHHLALQAGNVGLLEVYWGHCKGVPKLPEWEIFQSLFGDATIAIATTKEDSAFKQQQQQQAKRVLIKNDCAGYYAGQDYKNNQLPISLSNAWQQKLNADAHLFSVLLERFRSKHNDSTLVNNWTDYYTIGLHIRAGNGEQNHFVQAQRARGGDHLREYCASVLQLIQQQLLVGSSNSKPPALFLATDTPGVIAIVQSYFGNVMPVWTVPQERLDRGVGYHEWKHGRQCLNGWKASMTDMILLADCSVVVAAMRSTFTQILPRSVVVNSRPTGAHNNDNNNDDAGAYKYCEVSEANGRTMTCFYEETSWLMRTTGAGTTFSLDPTDAEPVVHKVMVHLPDPYLRPDEPSFRTVRDFFHNSTETNLVFGNVKGFNTKYRQDKNATFRKEWTLL